MRLTAAVTTPCRRRGELSDMGGGQGQDDKLLVNRGVASNANVPSATWAEGGNGTDCVLDRWGQLGSEGGNGGMNHVLSMPGGEGS